MTILKEIRTDLGSMSRDDFGTYTITVRALERNEPYSYELIMENGAGGKMSVLFDGETYASLTEALAAIKNEGHE